MGWKKLGENIMKILTRHFGLMLLLVPFAIGLGFPSQAANKNYTLGSLAEGTTPFLVNTAFAKAVNKYNLPHSTFHLLPHAFAIHALKGDNVRQY